ncbi:hypothetical protein DN757_18935 [Paenibacillus silvae]|uniref:Uncharacterized protein n=1 Tax=Paenibacillus silvae TaxID=1325358 RepID=A0A2W6NDP2_9BACL|nr:hypothetical protein DN757_18935 [Paenibacillus silvae]
MGVISFYLELYPCAFCSLLFLVASHHENGQLTQTSFFLFFLLDPYLQAGHYLTVQD